MTYRRRVLTDTVLSTLTGAGILTGDAERPDGGGWVGEPYQSDFLSYAVATPLSTARITGSMGAPSDQVVFEYSVVAYGGSRQQCEWQADEVRVAMDDLIDDTIDMAGVTAKIIWVTNSQYGGVVVSGNESPPWWSQNDIYQIWVSQ